MVKGEGIHSKSSQLVFMTPKTWEIMTGVSRQEGSNADPPHRSWWEFRPIVPLPTHSCGSSHSGVAHEALLLVAPRLHLWLIIAALFHQGPPHWLSNPTPSLPGTFSPGILKKTPRGCFLNIIFTPPKQFKIANYYLLSILQPLPCLIFLHGTY